MRHLLLLSSIACTGESVIDKQENSAPVILIGSHADGAEILEGYTESFRAQVSDDDNDFSELSIAWYLEENIVCDWTIATPAGESFCDIIFSPEDTQVIAEVRDDSGTGARAEVSVSVIATEAPSITLLSPLGGSNYYSNQLIQFAAIISDQEDATDELNIQWSSSIDGNLILDSSPDSTGQISDYTYLSEGQHAIELRVEDSAGKIAVEEVVLRVGAENTLPSCGISSPEEQAAFVVGDTIIFQGTAMDDDIPNNELQIEWSSNKDGVFDTMSPTSSGELSTSYSTLSADTHTITLTVQDEIGAICSDAVLISVGNPPTAAIENPLDGEIYSTGESIVFRGAATDTEDQPNALSVVWSSNLDGDISIGAANSQGISQFSSASLTAGLHSISFTVTDSNGLHADDLITFRVNTPPPTPTITLSPNPIYTTQDLTVSISNDVDDDGDNITYSYLWFENSVQTTFTAATIPSAELDVGEVWTVRITPNDGHVDGAFAETSITIANSNPVLSNLVITPSPAVYNTDIITCSAQADDDDEIVIPTYSWSIGSSIYPSNTLDLASINALPNQVATCTVTVADSNGGTDTLSQSITIENRSPVISSLVITPNTAVNINSPLLCTANASDPDGETPSISYEWWVEGVFINTGSTLALNSSLVSVGDMVQCSAIAEDSFQATVTDSISVSVQDSIPVFDIPTSISPSNPVSTNDTLTCTASATDSVDGVLPVSFAWTVNGLQVASGSTFIVTEANTDVGDSIECVATTTNSSQITVTSSSAVQLQNTPPTIDSIAISGDIGLYNDAEFTCEASISDPDEAVSPTYIWSSNAVVLGSGSVLDLSTISPLLSPNQPVDCIVNVTDSNGGSANDSLQEILEDREPTIPSIAITWTGTGAAPVEGADDLICTASGATDPDQVGTISYSYQWSSDLGQLVAGDTVPGTLTTANETWTCEVTSSDGTSSVIDTASETIVPDDVSYGPTNWGSESYFQNVMIYAVDMGTPQVGTLSEYTNFCGAMGYGIPQDSWPSASCNSGGGIFNSSGPGCDLYQTGADFFYNTLLPVYPGANYDNILIFQGDAPECWAHNAESGSMHAFGGPSGSGYAFCRGGDVTTKRYHIYVCKI